MPLWGLPPWGSCRLNFAKICALLPVGLLLLIPQRLFPAPGPAGIYSNLLRAAGSCPVVRYSSCNLQIQQGGEYIFFELHPRSTCCRYRIMQGGGCISRIVSRSPCNVGLWAALLILSPGGIPSRVTLRRFFVVPSARCGVSPGYTGIGPAGGCVPVVCDRSQSWKTLCPYIGIPSSCAVVGTRGTPGSSAIFGRFPIKEKGLCANL